MDPPPVGLTERSVRIPQQRLDLHTGVVLHPSLIHLLLETRNHLERGRNFLVDRQLGCFHRNSIGLCNRFGVGNANGKRSTQPHGQRLRRIGCNFTDDGPDFLDLLCPLCHSITEFLQLLLAAFLVLLAQIVNLHFLEFLETSNLSTQGCFSCIQLAKDLQTTTHHALNPAVVHSDFVRKVNSPLRRLFVLCNLLSRFTQVFGRLGKTGFDERQTFFQRLGCPQLLTPLLLHTRNLTSHQPLVAANGVGPVCHAVQFLLRLAE